MFEWRRAPALGCMSFLAVAATSPAWALTTRGSLEERFVSYQINDESPSNPENRVLKLSSWDNYVTVRNVLSDELFASTNQLVRSAYYVKTFGQLEARPLTMPGTQPNLSRLRLDEAYVDCELGSHLYLMLGKRRVNWGVGFFANPVDAINPPKYALDPNYYEEGAPVAMGELLLGRLTLGALFVRDVSSDLSTRNSRVGVRLGLLLADTEFKFYGLTGENVKSMIGTSVRLVLGDLVLYGELAGRSGNDRVYFNESGGQFEKNGNQGTGLVGFNYTLSPNSSASVEYVYDHRGYDGADMRNYFAALSSAPGSNPPMAATQNGAPLARHYIGVSVSAMRLRDQWDLGLRTLLDPEPPVSGTFIPYVMYRLTDVLTARVEDWVSVGESGSEYRNGLFRQQLNFYLAANF